MRLAMLAVFTGFGAWAAAPPPPPPEKNLKSPAPPSGRDLYRAHCASCHGPDGKGDGTVADSLRMRPSDLTSLRRRSGGEFPTFRLQKMLDGSEAIPVHGSKRMPVWGPGLGPDRSSALIRHLESIQK